MSDKSKCGKYLVLEFDKTYLIYRVLDSTIQINSKTSLFLLPSSIELKKVENLNN